MRYILLVFILKTSLIFSQEKRTNVELKLDSVLLRLNQLKVNSGKNPESINLEIQNLEKIFKKKETDWWEEYSSGIIAILAIIISSIISYIIASRQIEHNRKHNISEARIEWIQKLRPILANLISNATLFSEILEDEKVFLAKSKKGESLTDKEKEEFADLTERSKEKLDLIQQDYNQIKLFLNKKEKEHVNLDNTIYNYLVNALAKSLGKETHEEIDEDELIDRSRIVLKNAWEQAKSS